MEVYKITCKINNKIYIGSTKLINGIISQKNILKYPELEKRFKILNKKKRNIKQLEQ